MRAGMLSGAGEATPRPRGDMGGPPAIGRGFGHGWGREGFWSVITSFREVLASRREAAGGPEGRL